MITTIDHIIERLEGLAPQTAFILGSGLGGLVAAIEDAVHLPYEELDGFPASGVSGHAGELVVGKLDGLRVDVMPEHAGVEDLVDALAEHVAELRAAGQLPPPRKRRRRPRSGGPWAAPAPGAPAR